MMGKLFLFLDEQNLIGSKAAQYVGTVDGNTLPCKQINKSDYFAVLSYISCLQMLCTYESLNRYKNTSDLILFETFILFIITANQYEVYFYLRRYIIYLMYYLKGI